MNFFPYDTQFMEWTWSLSVEVQFYVTFPFFLLLLLKLPKRRQLTCLVLLVASSFLVRALVLLESGLKLPSGGLETYDYRPWFLSGVWLTR